MSLQESAIPEWNMQMLIRCLQACDTILLAIWPW